MVSVSNLITLCTVYYAPFLPQRKETVPVFYHRLPHQSTDKSPFFLIFRSIAFYEGFMSLWAAALMTGLWNSRPSYAIGFKGVTKTLQLTR